MFCMEQQKMKYAYVYPILTKWLENRLEGRTAEALFKRKGIQTTAIYGCGDLGELFFKELEGSDVQVKYFLDQNYKADVFHGKPVYSVKELPGAEKADAVVVTPVFYFSAIKKTLLTAGVSEKGVFSLGEVIESMEKENAGGEGRDYNISVQ